MPLFTAGSPGSQYVVDMSRVVPLRKQQGFLNMLGQLLSVLGPKAQPLLGNLFSVLLKVASGATQLLEERHLVRGLGCAVRSPSVPTHASPILNEAIHCIGTHVCAVTVTCKWSCTYLSLCAGSAVLRQYTETTQAAGNQEDF